MKKLTITEKRWDKGEKIYDTFCAGFGHICSVNTPKTHTLELFALLKEKNENLILLLEMMNEFITNFNDIRVFAEKGKLYRNVVHKERVLK